MLAGYSEEGVDNDILFVTSRLSEETVNALCEIQSASKAVSLVYFEPYSKLGNPAACEDEAEACLRELSRADINIQRISKAELI